ncbi:hypothetical protein F5Y02DRAFT_420224 [Annulohypoxylon stygium]|nr:hypothetical protein F5Y02DRAFT_420224 [Annulohypoxylon stygium]
MASTRSDEAVKGSVGSSSDSKPVPDPSITNNRLCHYIQDTMIPVNDHLSSAPLSQLGLSHAGPCSGPIRSIDNVLPGQQLAGSPVGQSSASNTANARGDGAIRGVGSSFDGFDAASPRPQVLNIDDDKTVPSSKK